MKKLLVDPIKDHGIDINKRIIWLESPTAGADYNYVDYAMYANFSKKLYILENTSDKPITIILNTPGGCVTNGMAIYSKISKSKCYITIKVEGEASSMGSIILQAADHRVVDEWATVMFHAGSAGSAGNPWESARRAQYELAYGKQVDEILRERINEKRKADKQPPVSKRDFDLMNLRSKYLTARQAVDLGLADEVT